MMNVLYFVCHDLGRALGCYGAGIPTPHLDAFASEGIRCTDAHCASPACSPSRACVMSGKAAHTTGALGLSHMGWPLHLDHTTSIDDFNGAGFQTILSGINHERHPRTEEDFIDCFDPIRAVRTERFLYLRNFKPDAKPAEPLPTATPIAVNDWRQWMRSWQLPAQPRPSEELYDLCSDPLELKNVTNVPAYANDLAYLRSLTMDWMLATDDFLPTDPPARPEQPGWGPHWSIT